MPRFLALDLETRSTVDLKRTGVYPYAAHPDTDVWCAAYAFDDGPVQVWFRGEPLPDDLRAALEDPAVYVRAWNAQFERILMRDVLTPRHGWPAVPLERFVCTMVAGRAAGLPGSLEEAAIALQLAEQKDMAGSRLMMQMAKPRRVEDDGTLVWWDDPVKLERLARYCAQDVAVEREVFRRLPPSLDRRERTIWLADQRINDRGIRLDRPLIEAMIRRVAKETAKLDREMSGLTSGAATTTGVAKIKAWVTMRTGEDPGSLDKDAIDAILERDDLPDDVRRVLEIRRVAAKASNAKLKAMLRAIGDDDVVRGLLQYYGAGTGRWAGRLVQPQNFPRGEVKITPETIDALKRGRALTTDPLETVSSALRGCLIADPGTSLFVADFAQIEARVVAWLAGQGDLLALFASGGAVYEEMAATIFNVPVAEVTKDQRQLGKMAVLGCGFQMGAARFAEQAGVELELAKTAVDAYRAKNFRIRALWWNAQDTAVRVVERGSKAPVPIPGTDGKLTFRIHGEWLAMGLPSGRSLWYYGPRIVMRPVPWDKTTEYPAVMIETVNGLTRKWETQTMYGGLWVENATQAVARDLMADAILRLEAAGYDVRLTVHDEVIATASPSRSVEEFVNVMSAVPSWAAGCPVAAEGWAGDRYRK